MAYKKGNGKPPNSGRKKGSINKATSDVLEIRDRILKHITADNTTFNTMLTNLMLEKPETFISFIGKIIPKDIKIEHDIPVNTPLAAAIKAMNKEKK